MKTLLAALAGFALIGAVGATQVNAQGVRADTRSRSTRAAVEDFRKPARVENNAGGHFQVIKKKVWIAGHYEHREVRVFVPAKHVTVRERRVDRHGCVFYVNVCKTIAAHYDIVCKEVFVPGRYEIREERVWVADNRGCEEDHGQGHGHATGHSTAAGQGQNKKKGGKHNRGRRGGRR